MGTQNVPVNRRFLKSIAHNEKNVKNLSFTQLFQIYQLFLCIFFYYRNFVVGEGSDFTLTINGYQGTAG